MILIDTDILIDYLRHDENALDFLVKNKKELAITRITIMECIAGCRTKTERKSLEPVFEQFHCLDINSAIFDLAIGLMEDHFLSDGTGLLDCLIAASAVYFNTHLATRNIKHYKNIPGLAIDKPY